MEPLALTKIKDSPMGKLSPVMSGKGRDRIMDVVSPRAREGNDFKINAEAGSSVSGKVEGVLGKEFSPELLVADAGGREAVFPGEGRRMVFDFLNEKDDTRKSNLSVGMPVKRFERKHGLRESKIGRFMRKRVTEPIGKGLKKIGDFGVKCFVQAKKDYINPVIHGGFSDKHNNYSYGFLPWVIRWPTNLGGTSSAVSLLGAKTYVGKKIIDYRRGRTERMDRVKNFVSKPFKSRVQKVSKALPAHEKRFNFSQKFRSWREKLRKKSTKFDELADGGVSGIFSRARHKKKLRKRKDARVSTKEAQ